MNTSDELQVFLTKVSAAVRSLPPRGVLQVPAHDAIVLKMFWRSAALFDAIARLLSQDFLEESLILARSLFVEALRLAQLSEAGDGRVPILVGFARTSVKEKKGLMMEAKRIGLDEDPSEVISALDGELRRIDAFARAHGIKKVPNFRSLSDAAVRYDRAEDYWTYQLSHEMVHGSDAAMMFRSSGTDSETVSFANRTSEPGLLVEVGNFSARSALQAAEAAARIFSWPLEIDVDELARQADILRQATRRV